MLNDWVQKGDYFTYCNNQSEHQIFYCDSGNVADKSSEDKDKPILVLIHGFPTASIDWQHIWPRLSKSFRLITLDMIGFGLSDKPKDYPYGIADQTNIFQVLIKQLGITEYHICAHDYGDTVAQELLARQLDSQLSPEEPLKNSDSMILSTILLNGGLFPETHRPVLMQKLLISPLGSWLIKLYAFKKFKKTFSDICKKNIDEEELSIYWQLLNYNNGSRVMPKLIRYMQERKQYRQRWVGALENTSVPLRLIDGTADPISGLHMVERYRQLINKPDVVELEDVGHYPQVEAPQKVISAALAFWKKNNIIN